MAKAVGEIRKFLSPEDEAALRGATREIKKSREDGDSEAEQKALDFRLGLKERIRENIEREAYSRAKRFGETLLADFEVNGYLPWEEIRIALATGRAKKEIKKDHSFVFEQIEGLSMEEKKFFSLLLNFAEEDYIKTEQVISRALGSSPFELRRHRAKKRKFVYDEYDLGKKLFAAANTHDPYKESENPSPWQGQVRFLNKGLFIELEIDSGKEIMRLWMPRDIIEAEDYQEIKEEINGFFSADRQFRFPYKSSLMSSLPLPVSASDNRDEAPFVVILGKGKRNPTTLAHEESHYFDNLISRTLTALRGDSKEKQPIEEDFEKLELTFQSGDLSEAKVLEIKKEYQQLLRQLIGNFIERAKDEVLADYRAKKDFFHLYNLLKTEETLAEAEGTALYDYFQNYFASRWQDIPEDLRQMIIAAKKDYYRQLEKQVKFAETILEMILSFIYEKELERGSENVYATVANRKYIDSFYALLQETLLGDWQNRLEIVYRRDLTAYRQFKGLCQRFYDAKDEFLKHQSKSDCGDRKPLNDLSDGLGNIMFSIQIRSQGTGDFPAAFEENRKKLEELILKTEDYVNRFKQAKGL